MTIIRRPQAGNMAGGPYVEGNKRYQGPKVKSPVRVKTGKKKNKGGSY